MKGGRIHFSPIAFSVITVINPAAKCGKSEDDPVGLISVTAAVSILFTQDAEGRSDPITDVEDGHTDSISTNLRRGPSGSFTMLLIFLFQSRQTTPH